MSITISIPSQLASAPYLTFDTISHSFNIWNRSTIVVYVQEEEGAELYRDVMAVDSALVHVSS